MIPNNIKSLPPKPGIYPVPFDEAIFDILKKIPKRCGVYRFLNNDGKLLYIGKAKNLHNRVKSYFTKSAELTPAKIQMVSKIKKIEYTVVANETEALLLEANLIKKHLPPYNIDLRDDKSWIYIKITNDDFPQVMAIRKFRNSKLVPSEVEGFKIRNFHGPYTSSSSVRQTMKLLRQLFPYYSKNGAMIELGRKANSKFHLGRYLEHEELTKDEWQKYIKQIADFLSGKTSKIIKNIKLKMKEASAKQNYEQAGKYHNQLEAIERLQVRQKVISQKNENEDYLNLYHDKKTATLTLLKVREGKLLDQLNFKLKNIEIYTEAEILEHFINQYYQQTSDLPKTIILPHKISYTKIKLTIPKKGRKNDLLKMAKTNAREYFNQQQASWEKQKSKTEEQLDQLQKILKLKKIPHRIEAYDISNIQGQYAVGSMVVMTDGKIDKAEYRKFKIKTVKGANDPKMMAEIIKRRFNNNWPIPNLILIDGGPTQLNSVLNNTDGKTMIISLAKKNEEIFLPHQAIPIRLPKYSPALLLLQQIRDEAHRFAITYYRKLHRKNI